MLKIYYCLIPSCCVFLKDFSYRGILIIITSHTEGAEAIDYIKYEILAFIEVQCVRRLLQYYEDKLAFHFLHHRPLLPPLAPMSLRSGSFLVEIDALERRMHSIWWPRFMSHWFCCQLSLSSVKITYQVKFLPIKQFFKYTRMQW